MPLHFLVRASIFMIACLTICTGPAYGDVAAEVTNAAATQRDYLSGTGSDATKPWDFFCTAGRNSGKWTTIPVPSCWELQGFGTFSYGTDDAKQPAEQGKYRHLFKTAADLKDRRVFLVFVASMTDTDVSVNGQPAGPVHQGAFYTFKYDVTKLLKPAGEDNLLEVTVSKKSARDSVNRAERQSDYWLFGGIFRPVYLETVPAEYVERVAIDAKADGTFTIDVFTPANTSADAVEVELRDRDGNRVGTPASVSAGAGARITMQIPSVSTWTAETPVLYTAIVRLKAGDAVRHEVTQRFGFRTIEVRPGDGIYVNGKRILLKGVCRHSFWPDTGRTLSQKLNAADVDLIKDMNMNAVRMSHYPPDPEFLELCDEKGLYVINELSGWQKSHDTEVGKNLVQEMIVRDVNHPSILFWANGNEGGWNTELDKEYAKWDPQKRAVLHPWATHDAVNTKHYPDYNAFVKLLAGNDVVMPTEFQHALYDGGGGAGLRDYWDAMRRSKVSAGAFFWVLADEGIVRSDQNGKIDVQGNLGPDGVVGPYREKEASFYTIKKIWSPVTLPEKLPEQFDGTLEIENGYDFTSLKDVKFKWSLTNWPGPEGEAKPQVVHEGAAASPDVAPQQRGVLKLDLPSNWKATDALSVVATDANGLELWKWVWALPGRPSYGPTFAGESIPSVTKDGVSELKSGNVTMRIDAATQSIQSLTVAGKVIPLTAGPRLALGASTVKGKPQPTGKLTQTGWTPMNDGYFKLEYSYEASGAAEYAGVTFDLPETSVTAMKWSGDGPFRVWKNRLEGLNPGVWETFPNNAVTGWSSWTYPEFKGYFANLRWAKLTLTEGSITIGAETPGLFFRFLTPELPPGKLPRTAMTSFPEGTISILHAIPAIGNKFQAADRVGPQSEPTQLEGSYSGSLWVRFQ